MVLIVFHHPHYFDLGDNFDEGWYCNRDGKMLLGPRQTAVEMIEYIRGLRGCAEAIVRIWAARAKGEKIPRLKTSKERTAIGRTT